MRKNDNNNYVGFTIVELLIVIVVIAILAAITIVAFNGVQQRARASAASASLGQAKKKLELYKVENSAYPTTGNLALAGVTDSDTTFQYTSTGIAYCLTATNGNVSYRATDSSDPTAGGCAGHGQGGVAAITNLVLNPRGGASNWFTPLTATVTRTTGVNWNGKTWTQLVSNGSGNATTRLMLNQSDLVNGTTYTVSFLVGNSGSSPVIAWLDFCDTGNTNVTVQPGEQKRVTFSSSRVAYDSVYRFVDLEVSTAGGNGILVTDGIVTSGSGQYGFADGNSTNWVWNGAANASTSTGPPL